MPSSTDTSADAAIPLWLANRQQVAAIAAAARKKRESDALEAEAILQRERERSKKPVSTDEMLEQYPSIPLLEYSADGEHLAINIDFPGLRAIHKDPWIFHVADLFTREECEMMMAK